MEEIDTAAWSGVEFAAHFGIQCLGEGVEVSKVSSVTINGKNRIDDNRQVRSYYINLSKPQCVTHSI